MRVKAGRVFPAILMVVWILGSTFEAGAAPSNDYSGNPKVIQAAPYADYASTVGATIESGEVVEICPGTTIGATVWYKWTPLINGGVTADTFGSDFDTVLIVITDTGGGFGMWACNDDAVVGAALFRQSMTTFTAVGGKTYYFQVGGRNGATGELKFALHKAPPNDTLVDAKPISVPHAEVTTNIGATLEQANVPGCPNMTGNLWYKVTTQVPMPLTIETSGSNFDTTVAVYEWVNWPGLIADVAPDIMGTIASPAAFNLLGCSDDFGGDKTSRFSWNAAGVDGAAPFGHTYYIEVGGKSGSQGILKFTLAPIALPHAPQLLPPTQPPPITPQPIPPPLPPIGPIPPVPPISPNTSNDAFASASPFPEAPAYAMVQPVRNATVETGEPTASCGQTMYSTVWFSLRNSQTVSATLRTTGSSYRPLMAVYEQTGSGFTGLKLVDCASPSSLNNNDMTFAWQAKKNVTYYVQVGATYQIQIDTLALSLGRI